MATCSSEPQNRWKLRPPYFWYKTKTAVFFKRWQAFVPTQTIRKAGIFSHCRDNLKAHIYRPFPT